jgi:predicted RNA binding protein YcfA (HicA-like mRNA interferase family)
MPRTIEQCRSGKEFVGYAETHGAEVRNGHGSHFVVSTEKGQCVVPVHPGELGKGLRCKIVKLFLLIGLALLLAACVLSMPGV